MTSIFDRLKKVIIEQLEVEEEQVIPEASFADDLNADSLDLIELITAVEEEFSSPGRKLEMNSQAREGSWKSLTKIWRKYRLFKMLLIIFTTMV